MPCTRIKRLSPPPSSLLPPPSSLLPPLPPLGLFFFSSRSVTEPQEQVLAVLLKILTREQRRRRGILRGRGEGGTAEGAGGRKQRGRGKRKFLTISSGKIQQMEAMKWSRSLTFED
eukprot:753187-Hanusia_phi.AAC.1